MPVTYTITRTYRTPNTDDVHVEATGPAGERLHAQLWWSTLQPLSAAQRRAAIGQALADALAAQTPVDLGITGTVTV